MRRFYRRVAHRSHDDRAHEVAELLKATALFGACSSGTLLELAEAMHARTYRAEECLYYEGDPGLGLYVVQRGCIRLLVEDQGAAYELRRAERGSVFGVAALVHDVQRLETTQTVDDARVLGLFRPDLTNLTKRNPRAGAEVAQAVARYLARAAARPRGAGGPPRRPPHGPARLRRGRPRRGPAKRLRPNG